MLPQWDARHEQPTQNESILRSRQYGGNGPARCTWGEYTSPGLCETDLASRPIVTPENVTLFLWEHVLTRPNSQSEAGKKRRKSQKAAEAMADRAVTETNEGEHDQLVGAREEAVEGEVEAGEEEELDLVEAVERRARGRLSEAEMSGLGEIAANAVYSRSGVAGMRPENALSEDERLGV